MRPLAKARPGHVYAALDPATRLVTRIFRAEELSSWDEETSPALDITGFRPRPMIGQKWDGRRFVPATPPDGPRHPDPEQMVERRRDLLAVAELVRVYCNAIAAGTYREKARADVKSDLKAILRQLE